MCAVKKSQYIHAKSVDAARKEYAIKLKEIIKDECCPFCIENIYNYHSLPIESKKYWLVTENMYPYTKGKHHFLFIAKRHIEDVKDLKAEEWKELSELTMLYMKEYSINNGGLFVKFGDSVTITHIHFHIVQDTRIGKAEI